VYQCNEPSRVDTYAILVVGIFSFIENDVRASANHSGSDQKHHENHELPYQHIFRFLSGKHANYFTSSRASVLLLRSSPEDGEETDSSSKDLLISERSSIFKAPCSFPVCVKNGNLRF
jgi:hypothetical protein